MEQGPHHPEGGEHRHETHETQSELNSELHGDEQRIERGIADALNDERAIDDTTAQRIAALLHTGQDSALYALASSGALPDRLEAELLESVQDLPPERDNWIDALLAYIEGRGEDRGPKEGWADTIGDNAQAAIEAARAAASRERRADRAQLERYVELGIDPGDAEALIEFQHMWRQQRAAEATPSTAQPDETEAAEGTTGPERPKRPRPRIYVRCLAAYNNGILHGQWIDVNRDAEALRDAVETMLNASPVPDAEEYAIHDYEGFTGYALSEHENLDFVSRLAQGIAAHGQAFAAYADWIGHDDEELERFNDHHEGTYPTREAWAEEVADEIFEWPRHRQAIPDILRPHVRLDLTDLALTLEQHRHIVEGSEGVYVFNPDA